MRETEEIALTVSEMQRILDEHGCRMDVWCADEDILHVLPYDDVMVAVYKDDGTRIFEKIILAEELWDVFDFLATLFDGGLLP
jgi:hypothetical protein